MGNLERGSKQKSDQGPAFVLSEEIGSNWQSVSHWTRSKNEYCLRIGPGANYVTYDLSVAFLFPIRSPWSLYRSPWSLYNLYDVY